MTCDYDKSWQRLNDLWQNAKAKTQKSLQGSFGPWQK